MYDLAAAKRTAKFLNLIARPINLRIITLLASEHTLGVTIMARRLGVEIHVASKHLRQLDAAGVVRRGVLGRHRYYSLHPDCYHPPGIDSAAGSIGVLVDPLCSLHLYDHPATQGRKPPIENPAPTASPARPARPSKAEDLLPPNAIAGA